MQICGSAAASFYTTCDIEEELGLSASADMYTTEAQGWGEPLIHSNGQSGTAENDEYVGSPGQIFCDRCRDSPVSRCVDW